MSLTGTEKSAVLLMTIGEDRAAEVFKHLNTREVQHLSAAMANMRQVSHQQLADVLREFEADAEQFAALSLNSNDYLRSVLVKALGEERAATLLEDILETRETTSGGRSDPRRASADHRHHPGAPEAFAGGGYSRPV